MLMDYGGIDEQMSAYALRMNTCTVPCPMDLIPCGVKLPGAWNLSLTSTYDEVNTALSYTCIPPYFVMEWCLFKYREKRICTRIWMCTGLMDRQISKREKKKDLKL
jgi:hypothetical protein